MIGKRSSSSKELLFNLQKKRDNAVEFSRLLKKKIKDLKDFLLEKRIN